MSIPRVFRSSARAVTTLTELTSTSVVDVPGPVTTITEVVSEEEWVLFCRWNYSASTLI